MKFFKQLTILSVLVFLTPSCTSYVDYNPKENYEITSDVYFQSADDYEAAVVGIYDPLQWTYLNVLIGDIASDNSLSGGESATDVIGLQNIDNMTQTPNNDNLTSIWKWLYEGVNRANYLEENKNKLDFDGKDQLYGEVYFLRAYYYFQLVKFFGDVPLFTTSRLSATDSGSLQRSPKSEVYAQIETDLLNAINALPTTQAQKGRVTKYAAEALLGKVYLFEAGADDSSPYLVKAANMLENVIGVYSFVPDYGSQFFKSGENGVASIFDNEYTHTSNWYDWGYVPQGTEGNFGVIHNGPRAYSGPLYASGWSFNVPTQDLYNSFDSADTRRDASILNMPEWINQTGASYAKGYKDTGFFNNKYIPRAGESGAQTELNYLNNYRAIRYADVLLMAAEANVRSSSPNVAKAQMYLDEVRDRAFGDTAHRVTATKQAIWDERNFELSMEGQRFFDLVRTGQAAGKINGFVTGKNEVFPIPQQEVDISGLTQNKGY